MEKISYINLKGTWKNILKEELQKEYMLNLFDFIVRERDSGKIIYPTEDNIFNAFNLTPFESVRVVIMGQDPYHGEGQAHGLGFSVNSGIKIPPSLKNIFKEINDDLFIKPPVNGCLNFWAKQGVLLLNSILSVEKGKAFSHKDKGWEKLTDYVISVLNEKHCNLVFILWGNDAGKKSKLMDKNRHLLLQSAHPSPLSAWRGFLGNKHFSKTNQYLVAHGKEPINWAIND
ncbi:MAG: uracil-DNA glycosylase [Desulfobacteraceae bacterium 4572_19]|nr:MAG: uracil-DNA glycosylase [Desulfobacteraceae bacterium 4572_19]